MNRESQPSNPRPAEPLSLGSTLDLVDLLWRRRGALIGSLLVAILAGLLYFLFGPATYRSSADVLLVNKNPEAIAKASDYESGFEDYLATHRALIVSPMIVERAIKNADLGSLPTFADADPEWLTETVIWSLQAESGPRDLGENADSIMNLAFEGPIAEDCPIIVQAVLDSYRQVLDEIYQDMSADTMKLIDEARHLLENDLKQQEEAYVKFRQRSPLVTRGTDEVNPLQDRLVAIETERTQLLIRRAEIEGQLHAIQNAKEKQLDDQNLLALVTDLRSKQTTTDTTTANVSTSLDTQILQLADREKELLEHFGPNHPRVVTVRKRIAAARRLLALPSTAYIQDPSLSPESEDIASDSTTVELYLESLQQELDRIKVSEGLLTEVYQKEHDLAKELSGFQLTDEGYRRNIDRTQQLYDGIISQLQEAGLIRDYGGFEARVIARPRVGEPISPDAKIAVAGSLIAGLGLGFVLAVFSEMRDKSFHSRQEIQSRLGVPVVAEIPRFAAASPAERSAVASGNGLDPMLCSHFQRRSAQSEAYRGLRTNLLVNHRSAHCRVIQLTSPSPHDGKSTIAANLAISLAQLGRRVLLLDGDLHRPRQHEIFGISAEKGLSTVIRTGESASEATYETSVEGLWLLPVGPLDADGFEFFTSPQFAQLLAVVRDEYDYVLIDSEPLLAVSDPCVIASKVDGVLLALRPTKDSRWRATRAKEMLDAIDVEPIGVVVNGVGGPGLRGYRDELSVYDKVYGGPGSGDASAHQ